MQLFISYISHLLHTTHILCLKAQNIGLSFINLPIPPLVISDLFSKTQSHYHLFFNLLSRSVSWSPLFTKKVNLRWQTVATVNKIAIRFKLSSQLTISIHILFEKLSKQLEKISLKQYVLSSFFLPQTLFLFLRWLNLHKSFPRLIFCLIIAFSHAFFMSSHLKKNFIVYTNNKYKQQMMKIKLLENLFPNQVLLCF